MLRPNAFGHRLDRAIEGLPTGWFLLLREVKNAVWEPFVRSPVGVYLDRKEHEHNMQALCDRWAGKPREEEFKNEFITETIRTRFGKYDLASRMAGTYKDPPP